MDYIQNIKNEEDYKMDEADHADELNNKIIQYMNANYDKKISLWYLANILAIDQSYLCKIFNRKYGITPVQYINNLRLQKAKDLLTYTEMSITEISEKVGFQSIHYFSRYFTNREKISPIEYKHRIKECIYITVEERYKDECHLA
jgi:transcriptional regulator GlxA family with amidase domain